MTNSATTTTATGPRTAAGKAISARNSLTHGLTARSPLLPTENEQEFLAVRAAAEQRYAPQTAAETALVAEYVDLHWRLRRIPAHEAKLIALELVRMRTDPAIADLLASLDELALEALALERLMQSHTLTNLHRQEARLTRRIAALKPELNRLLEAQALRQAAAHRAARKNASVQNELTAPAPAPAQTLATPARPVSPSTHKPDSVPGNNTVPPPLSPAAPATQYPLSLDLARHETR